MTNQDNTNKLIAENEELRQHVVALEKAFQENQMAADILQIVPLAIHELDLKGRITFVNPAQEAITGYTADELVGTYVWDRIKPGPERDSLPTYLEHLVSEQPTPTPFFAKNIRKNGNVFDVQVDWNYKRNLQGKVSGFVCIVRDISDHKRAVQAVCASEAKFRSLFQKTPVGVVVMAPSGEFLQANRAFCEFLGYSEQELSSMTITSVTYPEDREATAEVVQQAIQSGTQIQRFNKRYLHKSGQVRWGEVNSVLIFTADANPSYFIAHVLDIGQRKQAEEALQASEVKYRRLHQSMRDAFASVGMDGYIQEFNDAYREMLGYEPEEFMKLSYMDLTPQKWHSHEAEIVQKQILTRGYSDIYEKEYRRKDGTVLPVELRTFLIKDDHDQPCAMWAIVRDITERKYAEEALQKAHDELERRVEERTAELQQALDELRTIYDGIFDGLLVVDLETKRFVRANSTICRMLGYSEAELLSLKVTDLHLTDDIPAVLKRFKELSAGLRSTTASFLVVRKDGSVVPVDVGGNTLTYRGRPCLIGFFRDITGRRQAEEALKKERQLLWKMLQASDHERQLISYEIHDGLAQYLAAAGMQFQAYEFQRENMPAEAKKAYETAVELVRQAHAESRRLINEVRPPVIDEIGLETAISHLVHEQRKLGGPKIQLDSDVHFRKLPSILENALYRIAQEALTNACKHSKSRKVMVTLAQKGENICLEVRDWGMGFDTKSVKEGHFGLDGIYQRVRILGGTLTIESKPNFGTLVQVVVPILENQPES